METTITLDDDEWRDVLVDLEDYLDWLKAGRRKLEPGTVSLIESLNLMGVTI